MARRIRVEVIGDAKSLERALGRAETSLTKFGRTASSVSRGSSGSLGMLFAGRGATLGVAAGATAAAIGIRSAITAAQEAEVVLGQTRVAVQNAGIDWTENAARIEAAATKISKASALDDEDVLRSFQVFVRGQRDVEKAVELAGLAADVARGRYTSLESATQLVNKAAMGQIGALRRAGIQIDKNATATEALAELQRVFGGAAEKYANSSVGASERLAVAWENLREDAGEPLLGLLADLAEGADKLVEAFDGVQLSVEDLANVSTRKKIEDAFGKDALGTLDRAIVAPGLQNRREEGEAGHDTTKTVKLPPLVKKLDPAIDEAILDARIKGNDKALVEALKHAQTALQSALKDKRLKPADRVALKQSLLQVNDEIASIQQSAADAAKDTADDTKAAAAEAKRKQRAKQEAAKRKLEQELKRQGEALDDARDKIGELFAGPILSGPAGDLMSRFGIKPNASNVLADLRAQNKQAQQFTAALTRIRQRGGSEQFVSELLDKGVGALPEIQAVAGANQLTFRGITQAAAQRERLASRLANMTVHSQNVTINASNVSVGGRGHVDPAEARFATGALRGGRV